MLALALAAPVGLAAAQDPLNNPSQSVYGDDIPPPDPDGEEAAGLNSQIGSLPFTGMDVIILAGVALLLTGTGFALRRLSAPRGPTG